MWDSIMLRDILPLIAEYLRKKDCLSMMSVSVSWRRFLKKIVSNNYPITIQKGRDFREYEALSWGTIICKVLPYPKFLQVERLFLTEKFDCLDWDSLPKGIKLLSINITEKFEVSKKLETPSSITQLAVRWQNFPYFMLTERIKKLEFIPERKNTIIDFEKLNICKFQTLFFRPNNNIQGDISLLTQSFATLTKLTIGIPEFSSSRLQFFENLEYLNIHCTEIDIKNLPPKLKILHLFALKIVNFANIVNHKNITEYHIDYFSPDDKILFPSNVKDIYIMSNASIDKIPSTVRNIKCNQSHLDNVYQHLESFPLNKLKLRFDDYMFQRFPSHMNNLELFGNVNKNTFSDTMNITSMKLHSGSINLSFIPSDLRYLYVKKSATVTGAKPSPILKVFKSDFL